MLRSAVDLDSVEVSGNSALSIVNGFRSFTLLASRLLLEEGMGTQGPDGLAIVDAHSWHPLERLLRIFGKIESSMGPTVLYQVGLSIPRNAKMPAVAFDMWSGMCSINAGYHLNHRKDGRVMFSEETGAFISGIGAYDVSGSAPAKSMQVLCTNPYPCSFDLGVLTAMAQQFVRTARVVHDDSSGCRKRGGVSCTYLVSW
jgi:hypothetical protein